MSEYSEQFKDPRWQKFRLKVLEKDGFRCTICGDGDTTLHAHHLYYISKRKPWEYPIGCVLTVCEECHKNDHANPDEPFEWEILVSVVARSKMGISLGCDIGLSAFQSGAYVPEELSAAIGWSLRKKPSLWVELVKEYKAYRELKDAK